MATTWNVAPFWTDSGLLAAPMKSSWETSRLQRSSWIICTSSAWTKAFSRLLVNRTRCRRARVFQRWACLTRLCTRKRRRQRQRPTSGHLQTSCTKKFISMWLIYLVSCLGLLANVIVAMRVLIGCSVFDNNISVFDNIKRLNFS